LEKGTVSVTAEIVIVKLDQVKLTRKREEATGLDGLYLE
jgi:predicted DNA-binding protein with PD1-like motif